MKARAFAVSCAVLLAAFLLSSLTGHSASRAVPCDRLPGAAYSAGGELTPSQAAQYTAWAKCELAASIKASR